MDGEKSEFQLVHVPLGMERDGLSCVVFADGSIEGGEAFWLLRSMPEAQVYLGGIVDSEGGIVSLLECWVQTVEGFIESYPLQMKSLDNGIVDEHWQALRRAFGEVDGRGLTLGIEASPQPPVLLNEPMERDVSLDGFEVCQDEDVLKKAELPSYRGSLRRCLHGEVGGDQIFYSLAEDAPEGEAARKLPDSKWLFNREGGHVFLRPTALLTLSEYAKALSGDSVKSKVTEAFAEEISGAYGKLCSIGSARFSEDLFLHVRNSSRAHDAEVFHLKLVSLLGALEEVVRVTSLLKRPFLNLSPTCFGVNLDERGEGLPLFWSSNIRVAVAGAAQRIEGWQCFVRARGQGSSLYQMPIPMDSFAGSGVVRLREMQTVGESQLMTLKGSLNCDQDLAAYQYSLLRISLESDGRKVSFQAKLKSGSWEFVADNQVFPDWLVPAGEGYAGPCRFTIVPKLTSACDVYSLGMLGIHLLYGGGERPLSAYLDVFHELARELGNVSVTDLPALVENLLEADPERWRILIPEEVDSLVPASMRTEVLVWLLRMLTGLSEFCYCRNQADGSFDRPQGVYEQPVTDLRKLVRTSRGLVMGENARNAEIQEVIDRVFEKLT